MLAGVRSLRAPVFALVYGSCRIACFAGNKSVASARAAPRISLTISSRFLFAPHARFAGDKFTASARAAYVYFTSNKPAASSRESFPVSPYARFFTPPQ